MSALYFRGKIAYALHFADPTPDGVFIIAPGFGLVPYDWRITEERMKVMSKTPVDVGKREFISGPGRPIPAFRVELEFSGLRTTSWVTDTGEVVREESPLGLITVRETAERARAMADHYWAPLLECIRAMVPPRIRGGNSSGAGPSTRQGLTYLRAMFGRRRSRGVLLAQDAMPTEVPERVAGVLNGFIDSALPVVQA